MPEHHIGTRSQRSDSHLRRVRCWICGRALERLPGYHVVIEGDDLRDLARFIVIEDDGCGEWECISRKDCYEAYTEGKS